jgi:hypothetical protein
VSALRAFLGELIDDAGLYPPAALPLSEALAANERGAAGPEYWMLGRFVVPAAQVGALARLLDDSPDPLECSVVVDAAHAAAEFADLARLEAERGDRIAVEALEARLTGAPGSTPKERIAALAEAVDAAGWDRRPALFIELTPEEDLEATFDAVRSQRMLRDLDVCAKLRCGGTTAAAVPEPGAVARFIAAARDAGVPFKATAGLHHPFRHYDKALGGAMHGFINVIGAAVLAASSERPDEATLCAIVADEDAANFKLDDEWFGWRERRADREAIGGARMRLIRSYGSCSFSEPVDDLRAAGILPRS